MEAGTGGVASDISWRGFQPVRALISHTIVVLESFTHQAHHGIFVSFYPAQYLQG